MMPTCPHCQSTDVVKRKGQVPNGLKQGITNMSNGAGAFPAARLALQLASFAALGATAVYEEVATHHYCQNCHKKF